MNKKYIFILVAGLILAGASYLILPGFLRIDDSLLMGVVIVAFLIPWIIYLLFRKK